MVYISPPGLKVAKSTVSNLANRADIVIKALGWTLIALDILLTIGRYMIRWVSASRQGKPPGIARYGLDDAFHLLALVVAIIYVALTFSGLAMFVEIEKWNSMHKGALDYADEYTFFHIRLGCSMLFWVGLFSVKASFLMLYRHLFWVKESFRKYWYAVLAWTTVCFLANTLACLFVCGVPANPLSMSKSNTPVLLDEDCCNDLC